MKQTWHYFNTPIIAFIIVLFPITGFMMFFALMPQQYPLIRATAGLVIAGSLYAFNRGYIRRLRLEPDGARFFTLSGSRFLPWKEVMRIDRYSPSGAVNGAKYVYLTKLDRPPSGLADQDEQTIQMQDRPGLLEAIRAARDGIKKNQS